MQPTADLVAGLQRGDFDAAAIHVRPVPRLQILQINSPSHKRMPQWMRDAFSSIEHDVGIGVVADCYGPLSQDYFGRCSITFLI